MFQLLDHEVAHYSVEQSVILGSEALSYLAESLAEGRSLVPSCFDWLPA